MLSDRFLSLVKESKSLARKEHPTFEKDVQVFVGLVVVNHHPVRKLVRDSRYYISKRNSVRDCDRGLTDPCNTPMSSSREPTDLLKPCFSPINMSSTGLMSTKLVELSPISHLHGTSDSPLSNRSMEGFSVLCAAGDQSPRRIDAEYLLKTPTQQLHLDISAGGEDSSSLNDVLDQLLTTVKDAYKCGKYKYAQSLVHSLNALLSNQDRGYFDPGKQAVSWSKEFRRNCTLYNTKNTKEVLEDVSKLSNRRVEDVVEGQRRGYG